MARLVIELLRPYKGWLAITFLAMLVEIGCTLAAPWPLKFILDEVLGNKALPDWLAVLHEHKFGRDAASIALIAGASTIVIAVLAGAASYVDNYFSTSIGQWVANDLRLRLYEQLQRLSLRYYGKVRIGSLVSTLTTDVSTLQSFASSSTLDIVVDLLTIVFMVGIMFWMNWDFTLIAIAIIPFMLLFISHFKRLVKDATRELREKQSDILSVVEQGLGSVRVVQAFGRQDLEVSHLAVASQATVDAALRVRRVKSLLSPTVNVVAAICTGIVLWRGTVLILSGAMTAGELTVYLAYLAKFFKPVQDLASTTSAIAQAFIALERTRKILAADDVIREHPDARDPGRVRGGIEFQNVSFGYDDDLAVLRDVTFAIAPGQVVGIVGPTGSGKSTVLSLLPRFYDAKQGRIAIDGIDVTDFKLAALRAQIGFVLQETVLFRGTIRENIAYGRPGATEEEVVAAARIANADEFIARMPKGYDTMVGERGDTLSGGQRQRVGIARAIVRDSPIMILDEPTAALDTESEHLVIEGLRRMMAGRTVIMIAHRLSTIRDADKIIVLKDGVVAEEGSHHDLIARGGLYSELNRAQFEAASA